MTATTSTPVTTQTPSTTITTTITTTDKSTYPSTATTTRMHSPKETEKYITEVPVLQTTRQEASPKTTLVPDRDSDEVTQGVEAEAAKSLHLNIEVSHEMVNDSSISEDNPNAWEEPRTDYDYTTMLPKNVPSQSKITTTQNPVTSDKALDIETTNLPKDAYVTRPNTKRVVETSDDFIKKDFIASVKKTEKTNYKKTDGDFTSVKQIHTYLNSGGGKKVIETGDEMWEGKGIGDSSIPASKVKTTEPVPQEEPYKWIPLYWRKCSRHCGGGIMTRKVICVETKTTNEVPSANCYKQKKPTHISTCNEHSCLAWAVSDWSPCSATCGSGVQKRDVYCPKVHKCDLTQKPLTHHPCNEASCIVWVAGSWSECSKTCGGGEQARHVQCVNQTSYEPVEGCDESMKPLTQQKCNTDKCAVQNAALMDWHHSHLCTANQMSSHVCTILKKFGHCSQRYLQVKCCRTCRPSKKSKKYFITA